MFRNIITFFLTGSTHVFHYHQVSDVLLGLLELFVLFYNGIIGLVLGMNQYKVNWKQTEPSLLIRQFFHQNRLLGL
jgi:hypothetical protein